jgi:hypothetical protein
LEIETRGDDALSGGLERAAGPVYDAYCAGLGWRQKFVGWGEWGRRNGCLVDEEEGREVGGGGWRAEYGEGIGVEGLGEEAPEVVVDLKGCLW